MIIAVDPGTHESAYCVLDGDKIVEFDKVENMAMMDILASYSVVPNRLAIEMIASYGMAVGKEVFETCVWIGRFIEAFKGPYRYVYRREVKLHICHSPKANDSNIRQALIDRFGEPGVKKAPGKLYGMKKDIWSAFAIGLTAQETKETV